MKRKREELGRCDTNDRRPIFHCVQRNRFLNKFRDHHIKKSWQSASLLNARFLRTLFVNRGSSFSHPYLNLFYGAENMSFYNNGISKLNQARLSVQASLQYYNVFFNCSISWQELKIGFMFQLIIVLYENNIFRTT